MLARQAPLAIFDLDHTLLDGDTDTLWCDYLVDHGHLPAQWRATNQQLALQYRAGSIEPAAFSHFYAQTLSQFAPAQLLQVRHAFTQQEILPRIKPGAFPLLEHHRSLGDTLVLSSATSHFLCCLTAQHLGIEHVLGTELEVGANGHFTGRTQGMLNMREGKVARMRTWLAEQGADPAAILAHSTFYSDSINDLPLLLEVGYPVAVDPDAQLHAQALEHQWPVRTLYRP